MWSPRIKPEQARPLPRATRLDSIDLYLLHLLCEQAVTMFMLHLLLSCCTRCKRRQSKSLAPSTRSPSPSPSPSPPPPLDIVLSPAACKTRVRAVGVNESDMYSVLNTMFERGTFEVLLDRDTYTITAPRQLSQVSCRASSQQPRGKPPLTLPIAGGAEQILYVTEKGEGERGKSTSFLVHGCIKLASGGVCGRTRPRHSHRASNGRRFGPLPTFSWF